MDIKSVLIFICIAIFPSLANATEYIDYQEALERARSSNSLILVYSGAKWCEYCKKMELVLNDKQVEQKLNDGLYIVVKLDIDKEKELKNKFSIKTIPDLIVIDKDENVLKRDEGYKDKKAFLYWIKN